MKIALFYPRNPFGCWYAIGGYKETLERMGHTVLDCYFPHNFNPSISSQELLNVFCRMPLDEISKCDVVLSAYHEYTQPWLSALFGSAWQCLKVPIIARFDESMDRADLGLPGRMGELKRWAQQFSFPAAQDAKKYGGLWHPFGADTTIFKPGPAKKYEIGFIGTLYETRKAYLEKLAPHLSGVTFRCGQAFVQDIAGIRERESTELLAENYAQLKIFFCLPPLSRLLVEKVFEVMACDTLVMYPRLFGDAEENLSIFEDMRHIVYYDIGYVAHNAKQIKYFLEHDAQRETIARAGGQLVRSEYTLELMLRRILDGK